MCVMYVLLRMYCYVCIVTYVCIVYRLWLYCMLLCCVVLHVIGRAIYACRQREDGK